MRIGSGKYRRRKLQTNPGLVTRPIADRVKEMLFNHLRDELEDRRVADVFAGTGTIGLEALSQGAASVVFIENDHRAHDLLKKNVAMLHAEPETLCWRTDVFRCSFRPKGMEQFLPYDIVFFDPPYRMIRDLVPKTPLYKSLERLARDSVTSEDALLLLRTPVRAEMQMPPVWQPDWTMEASTMHVHWFRKQGANE